MQTDIPAKNMSACDNLESMLLLACTCIKRSPSYANMDASLIVMCLSYNQCAFLPLAAMTLYDGCNLQIPCIPCMTKYTTFVFIDKD